MTDSELERFKNDIDLRAYAAGQGYQLSKESWRGSAVMRHPVSDDKVIIKRGMDGHYVYFSVRDDRDNGSIIDFVQHRNRGVSLGAVRKELRPWIGQPPVLVPAFPALHRTEKDRMKVEAAYARMREAVAGHPYLENERALPASLLGLPRFAGCIRTDARGNAVFPHFDQEGLCGYEMKNRNFTGFASGGMKGLWLSHELHDDSRIVFCEAAIDSLSHAALFPDEHARYASIGGKLNPIQPELIRAAIARMPSGFRSEVVSAMDSDEDGSKLTEIVRQALALSGRGDLVFKDHRPAGAKDWNDALKATPKLFVPCRRQEPSVA